MSKSKSVLIAGAGIAGPSLGLLLSRNGHIVTIIERAPQLRTTGQQIDLAGKSVNITKAMSVWDSLLACTVGDQGIKFVDGSERIWAAFAVDRESRAQAFVKEVEILTGDIAEVLYQSTRDDSEYIFGNTITALDENDSHVTASFSGLPDRDFDIVVAADGLYSKTGDIAFGKSSAEFEASTSVAC